MTDRTIARWQTESPRYGTPHLRLRQIAALVNERRPSSVIDLGCSTGAMASLVAPAQYVGCDFVEPPARGFQFHRCDFNREPLPEALPVVDAVVCSGLLEYVEDIPGLLAQVREHVHHDSVLVVSYVNMNHVLRVADMALGRTMCSHPDWRGFWSPRDLPARIEEGGFRVVETYETTRGLRPEGDVSTTADAPYRLRRAGRASRLLAHELLFVARPR